MENIFKIREIAVGSYPAVKNPIPAQGVGELKNLNFLSVGERGRGRWESRLAVFNSQPEKGLDRVELKTTRKGSKVLVASSLEANDEKWIGVLKTPIGFRGWNSHMIEDGTSIEKSGDIEIIARGTIAQGDAGRMGSGDQYIAVIPFDRVVKIELGGRLYGSPSEYYICWFKNEPEPIALPEDKWELYMLQKEEGL